MLNSFGLIRLTEELKEEFHAAESISYEDVDGYLLSKANYPSQQPTLLTIEAVSMEDAFSSDALYPPKKRLKMLIDVIEHAVINVVDIEDYIAGFFKKRANIDEIKFYSDRGDGQGFILNRQDVLSRTENAKALRGLLENLRSQIH